MSVNASLFAMSKALCAAALEGNLRKVRDVLEKGRNVETDGEPKDMRFELMEERGRGRTALQLAAEHGHLDCVKLLLEAVKEVGPDKTDMRFRLVRFENYADETALHVAASKGHVEVVRALLEAVKEVGPDKTDMRFKLLQIDNSSASGNTALNVAVLQNHAKVVRALLEAVKEVGPDKTDMRFGLLKDVKYTRTHHVTTLLHVAASDGHVEVVRALLEAVKEVGPDKTDMRFKLLQIVNSSGITALHLAVMKGFDEIVNVMLIGLKWANDIMKDGRQTIDIGDSDGRTALSFAVRLNFKTIAQSLWNHGADVNLINLQGSVRSRLNMFKNQAYGKALSPDLNKILPGLIRKVELIFGQDMFTGLSVAPMVWYAARQVQQIRQEKVDQLKSKKQRTTLNLNNLEREDETRLLVVYCAKYLDWLFKNASDKVNVKERLRMVYEKLQTQYDLEEWELTRVPRRRGPALRL